MQGCGVDKQLIGEYSKSQPLTLSFHCL